MFLIGKVAQVHLLRCMTLIAIHASRKRSEPAAVDEQVAVIAGFQRYQPGVVNVMRRRCLSPQSSQR